MLFIFKKPVLPLILVSLLSLVLWFQSQEIKLLTDSYFLANFLPLKDIQVNIGYIIALLFLLSILIYGITTIFDIPKGHAYITPTFFFLYSLWYIIIKNGVMVEDIISTVLLYGILYHFSLIVKMQSIARHLFYIGILLLSIILLQPLLIWLFIPLFLLLVVIRSLNFINLMVLLGGILTMTIWVVSYFYFYSKITILEIWLTNLLNVQKTIEPTVIYQDNVFYFVLIMTLFSLILTGNYLLTKYSGQKETERKTILLMYFLFFSFLCYIPLYFTTTRVFPFLLLTPFSIVLLFFISWTSSKVYKTIFLILLLLLPFFCHFGLPLIFLQF